MFVLVIGGGKTGSHLATQLLEQGYQVKVIDDRPAGSRASIRRSRPVNGTVLVDPAGPCRCGPAELPQRVAEPAAPRRAT